MPHPPRHYLVYSLLPTTHNIQIVFLLELHLFIWFDLFNGGGEGKRVRKGERENTKAHMWRSLAKSGHFFFHYAGPRDWTQVPTLGSKLPYVLSPLVGPAVLCKAGSIHLLSSSYLKAAMFPLIWFHASFILSVWQTPLWEDIKKAQVRMYEETEKYALS